MSPTPSGSRQSLPVAAPVFRTISERAGSPTSAWTDRDYALVYNYFLLACVAVFLVRRLGRALLRLRRRRAIKLDNEKEKAQPVFTPLPPQESRWWAEKGELAYRGTELRVETSWQLVERVFTQRLPGRWYTCGMRNWTEVLITVALLVFNISFMLVGTIDWTGDHTPVSNQMPQVPFIFALTGRNSVVGYVTGIDYLQLRFVHKSMAFWMSLEALVHTVEACLSRAEFFGGKGVYVLFFHNQYGQTGIVLVVGILILLALSPKPIRNRCYELFLVAHVFGAVMILVGLFYHVPRARVWVWVPIGIWAFERGARVVQVLSITVANRWTPRSPVQRATALLKDGAIILRVPYKGSWAAGQHAYLSFPGLALGQSHPFSIANVPSDFNIADAGGYHEMLFVIGVRQGVTATVAKHLDQYTSRSGDLKVIVEGPLGISPDHDSFENVLLFAGGTGITHIASLLADLTLKAIRRKTRVRKIKLVWTVRAVEQCSWVMPELLEAARVASMAGVSLAIDFYVTRGPLGVGRERQLTFLPPHHGSRNYSVSSIDSFDSLYFPQGDYSRFSSRRSSMVGDDTLESLLDCGADAAFRQGRPDIAHLASSFVKSGLRGQTLVSVCGPPKMATSVALECNKLARTHRVSVETAVFEC
ncbi:ferric-chelate reductase [Microbotryomycetes sp. JL201]|nr:ferric-chelate reductase [Microbotryomycetes sp. JL201]